MQGKDLKQRLDELDQTISRVETLALLLWKKNIASTESRSADAVIPIQVGNKNDRE